MPSPTTPLQFSSEEYQSELQELWERENPFNSSQDTLVNDLERKPLPPLPIQPPHEEAEMEAVEPFQLPHPTQSSHEEAEKEVLLHPFQQRLPTQLPHEETEKELTALEPSQSPLPTQLRHKEAEKEVFLEQFQPTLPTQPPHEEAEKDSPLGVVFPLNLRLDIPAGPHIMNPTGGIPWRSTPDNEQTLHDKLIIGVDVQVFLPKAHKDAPTGALMMDPNIPYPDILKDPITGIIWHPTSDNDHQHKEVIPGANFLPRIYGPLSCRIPVTEPVDYPHVLIHSATGINWVPATYAYYQWRSTPPQNYPFYASSIARTSSLTSTPTALNPTTLTSPAVSLVSSLSSASTSAITSQPQPPGACSAYELSIDRTSSLVSTPTAPSSASTSSIMRTSSSASTSSWSSTSTIKRQREQENTDKLSIAATSSPVSPSTELSAASTSNPESTSTITREMERYALVEFSISTAPFHALKTRLFSNDRSQSSASISRDSSLRNTSTSTSTLTSQPTSALPTNEPSIASTEPPVSMSTESSVDRTLSSASMSTIQREREREFTYDPSLARTDSTSTASSTRRKKTFAQKYVPERYYRGWKWRMSGSDPNSKWLLQGEEYPTADFK